MLRACGLCRRTRAHTREEKNINNFLDMPKAKWVENCFEVSGGTVMLVIVILVVIMLVIVPYLQCCSSHHPTG